MAGNKYAYNLKATISVYDFIYWENFDSYIYIYTYKNSQNNVLKTKQQSGI